MAGIDDKERYVIDMSLSGKYAHLSTRLATERLSMTGLICLFHNILWAGGQYTFSLGLHVECWHVYIIVPIEIELCVDDQTYCLY